MTITEMHYEFVLRTNKIDALANKEFTPEERDRFLNEAIIAFVNRSYNGTNAKRLAFEQTQEMLDELRSLVIHAPATQPWIAPQTVNDDIYVFDLNMLTYEYLHMIRVIADISGCSDRINVNMVQYDDLNYYLSNHLTKPSSTWKRVIGVISGDKLIIYSDKNFQIEQVAPSYIKYPAEVSLAGYVNVNGDTTVNIDCDLPKNTHNKIIDLAVLIAQGSLENQMGYQTAQNKVVINS